MDVFTFRTSSTGTPLNAGLATAAMATATLLLAHAGPTRAQDASAFQSFCESRLPPGSVEVTASAEPVQTLSDEPLARLSSRIAHRANEHVLGVTQTHLSLSASVRGRSLTLPAGTCFRPNIAIALKLTQQVRVAVEFPPGTCSHDAISDHETRHVQANLRQLDATRQWLQDELARRYENRVLYGASPRELTARVEADRQEWLALAKRKFSEVNAIHARIDSTDEYQRTSTLCSGQIARVLRAATP